MARTKTLNFVVRYGDSGYYINDLGIDKSPRFELYHEDTKKSILKTDDPTDCHDWIKKNIWQEFYQEEPTNNTKRKKKNLDK